MGIKYFGVNQNQAPSTVPYVAYHPSATMERTYKGFSPGTTSWPAMNLPGAVPCWSIRPDPASLFKGDYDAALRAIAENHPPGAVLSAYHEAQLAGIAMATDVKVQQYIHKIIHSVTSTLPFGNITLPGASANWDAEGLDWYAIDVYDFNGTHNPLQPLNFWYNRKNSAGVAVRKTAGMTLVTETNERNIYISHRPAWFAGVFSWLQANNGYALLSFWNPNGKWSGPFESGDHATLAELNSIAAAAASTPPLIH